MGEIFLKLLNMSIAASWLILAVILLRLLFKKAPKWLPCALWAIVAVRLICPSAPESSFSLIPSTETIPVQNIYSPDPAIADDPYYHHLQSGIPQVDRTLTPVLTETKSIDLLAALWIIGMIVIFLYALVNYLRIRAMVREAVPFKDNVRLCDAVRSPFILGIVRPRIYLPSDMDHEQIDYVLAHERAHLKRRDHWWKPLGYLLFTVYWFNPLVWAAYILLCRDIELACDEKVVKGMDSKEKKSYSEVLVSCSMQRRMIMVCPLAFGEVGVKERVKTVLNYKRPAFWLILAAIIACVAVAICFLTNPPRDIDDNIENVTSAGGEDTFNHSEENRNDPSVADGADDKADQDAYAAEDVRVYTDAESAITDAILERYASTYPESYDFACCDFVLLGELSETPVEGDTTHTITYYGWALYTKFNITEQALDLVGSTHLPIALTFELNDSGYHLKEYWETGSGSYFVSGVREKFPADIAEDGTDSQKFAIQQMQSCYDQAIQYSGLDAKAVVGDLLNTICSDPAASSDPKDYIDAHVIEYHELLYYGEHTLRYCFKRFENGGETGLEGKVMAVICEELLQSKGKIPEDAGTAETGQFWYDTLWAHGSNMVEPYLE